MLKLTAEKIDEGKWTTEVEVFDDGSCAGVLAVETEHANELVGLLNAATELREVTQEVADLICDNDVRTIAELVASPNCTCLPCRARRLVAKAKGGAGC